MDGNIVDTTDFAILFAVKQHDTPPWKNKIHGWIVDSQNRLPGIEGVSVQTVGRRVDSLVNDDLLETVIVSPEDIKRDLIIAFKLTEKGRNTVTATRERLLAKTVEHRLFPEQSEERVDSGNSGAVATLLADKLGWADQEEGERLRDEYGSDELSAFVVLRYVEQRAEDMLEDGSAHSLRDILQRTDDVFAQPSVQNLPQQ